MQLMSKDELRAKLKSNRISPELAKIKSGRVARRLEAVIQGQGTVLAFRALPEEPDLLSIFSKNWSDFAFAKIEGDDLAFYQMESEDFVKGPFDVLEPNPDKAKKLNISEAKVALVPGVAFDRRGVRLGRGKGFYDKALEKFEGLKVGVCFSNALVDEDVPKEEHDIIMDIVVTEDFILEPVGRKGT